MYSAYHWIIGIDERSNGENTIFGHQECFYKAVKGDTWMLTNDELFIGCSNLKSNYNH